MRYRLLHSHGDLDYACEFSSRTSQWFLTDRSRGVIVLDYIRYCPHCGVKLEDIISAVVIE